MDEERILEVRRDFESAQREVALGGHRAVKAAKRMALFAPTIRLLERRARLLKEIAELLEYRSNPELKELAMREHLDKEHALRAVEQSLESLLHDESETARNAILEVRAGTGGDEAELFAEELVRMYQRFAQRHGWKVEMLVVSLSSLGGVKESVDRKSVV